MHLVFAYKRENKMENNKTVRPKCGRSNLWEVVVAYEWFWLYVFDWEKRVF